MGNSWKETAGLQQGALLLGLEQRVSHLDRLPQPLA